jgi:methionine-S-sulfoxide reductase
MGSTIDFLITVQHIFKNFVSMNMKYWKYILLICSIMGCMAKQNKSNNMETIVESNSTLDTITLGGGCFWCIEAVYDEIKGVLSAESGYMGGMTKNPTYKDVCTGTTGHAEVVRIVYDTNVVTLEEILEIFFTVHDPTTLNRQGADTGTQYRSVIFYNTTVQKNTIEGVINALNKENIFGSPVVTQLSPSDLFYKAEDYHQEYYANNPEQAYCAMVIRPKVEKFKKIFQSKLK